MAFALLAMMLAVSLPGQAQEGRGHGFSGVVMEHHGFEGRHFDGHDGQHFHGHDFDRRHFEERRFGFVPFPYFYSAPYEVAPSYWYYCPSYDEYYPSVTSCPEPWVTVPAG